MATIEEQPKNKKRTIIATIITVVLLLIISLFAWRVIYFMRLIQSGQLTLADLSFVSEQTLSDKIIALPIPPEGQFDVVTTDDPSLGSAQAKVTIVEFADFGCPYSQKSSFVLRSLARKYSDQINYIYRDFPIVEIHPEAQMVAEAGECAHDQGKFWEYHDKVYLNQTDLREERLVQFAEELNMNVRTFSKCLESGKHASEVLEDYQAGLDAGVRGTPTFFINGNRIPGSIPQDVLEALILRFMQP